MTLSMSITGNLGHDPEVKVTKAGKTWTTLSVAHTNRRKTQEGEWEDDGPTLWFRVALFGDEGERAAEQLHKGDRVHVVVRKFQVTPYTRATDDQPAAWLDVTGDVYLAPRKLQSTTSTGSPFPDDWTGEPPF